MAKRVRSEDSKFYFNEFKHFPVEKLFIPILIAAVAAGIFFGAKAIIRMQGPAVGVEKIMTALQAGDGEELSTYLFLTDDQRRRMEYNTEPKAYGDAIIGEFHSYKGLGYKIVSFKVNEQQVEESGDKRIVPVTVTVRADKDGSSVTNTIRIPVVRDGGRWRVTSADLRQALNVGNQQD
jgi:hypothetical protein